MTTFDTGTDTATVAAGWSASPLGHPDDIFLLDEPSADPVEPASATAATPAKRTWHAVAAAAVLGGIVGGAALGLTFLDRTPDGPTVVGPATATQRPVDTAPTHGRIAPPVAATTVTAATPAPKTADVSAAPTAGPTAVVDVPTASAPPAPVDEVPPPPAPEEPQPQPEPGPPLLDGVPFEPPQPQPPVPPVFEPDLPLAPAPQPAPQPDPLPDLNLKAGPSS
jgi:hypothetical protein